MLDKPERQLLLHCAQTWMNHEVFEQTQVLANSVEKWDLLIQTAQKHQVLPLFYHVLERDLEEPCQRHDRITNIPTEKLNSIRQICICNAAHNLVIAQELIRLLELFKAHNLPAIPYKGAVLATSLYGDLSLRQFNDLDILVAPEDFNAVKDLLVTAGYQSTNYFLWEETFTHHENKIDIDLHRNLGQSYFPFSWNFAEFWQRCQSVKLLNRQISTFSDEDLLLVLSMQIAKDCHHQQETLAKICDIAVLLQRTSQTLAWDQVFTRAEILGCKRLLLLGISLACQLLEAEVPTFVEQAVCSNWIVGIYSQHLINKQILQSQHGRGVYDMFLRGLMVLAPKTNQNNSNYLPAT